MVELLPMTDRIVESRKKRELYASGQYLSINTERTKIYTDYYKAHENEYPILKRAGALYTWCATKEIRIFDDDIFVGSTGPEQRTLCPYVELECAWIPKITDRATFKQAWQSEGSIYMSEEQRDILDEAYDYWKDRNLSSMVRGALPESFNKAFGNGSILEPHRGVSGAPQGHYIANYNKVINKGFGAIREEILQKIAESEGKVFGKDAEKHIFYHAVLRVCDGAILLAKRYSEACKAKAEATEDPARKAEFLMMADSLNHIMEHPARTYWEGLEATLLYQILLSTDGQQHGQSIGRLDQYVGHLLDSDLEKGLLTHEQAQEYSDAFVIRLTDLIRLQGRLDNNYLIELLKSNQNIYTSIYNGLTPTAGIAITVGGQKPDGTDACNECTYKLLQSFARLRFPDPTVALRICDSTPERIWQLAIESSKISGGVPQFNNDNLILPLMQDLGFNIEEARNYSIVGCVEPAGTGNEWPACGMTGRESIWNMVNLIPITINGGYNKRFGVMGLPCKKLYEYESFEEFKESFAAQMQHALDWTVSYANIFELVYSHYFPAVSASVAIDGCIENGKDATAGGAQHNRCGLTAIGTSNVGDSLMSIKKLCFDDKTVSLQDMYDALNNNWVGYEWIRELIERKVPHYGNDIDEVDELAAWAIGKFADIMDKEMGPRGHYSGGTFTMTAHIFHGSVTPATPDGRADGDPLADAISPRQGFDKNGPTAYLKSAAKLPHRALTNGDQLNIRFSPKSVADESGIEKLKNLIRAYFMLGGMQVQFNVVSSEQLHAAQEDPEKYKNLVVRIAGFSTYFVSLNKVTQDDFITRTEECI